MIQVGPLLCWTKAQRHQLAFSLVNGMAVLVGGWDTGLSFETEDDKPHIPVVR